MSYAEAIRAPISPPPSLRLLPAILYPWSALSPRNPLSQHAFLLSCTPTDTLLPCPNMLSYTIIRAQKEAYMPANTPSDIYLRPVELAQNLLRFDTTNPPGNEAACISYIEGLLKDAGIETTIVSRDPARANLIARLKGRGEVPAILLHGHVDVVTTAN